MTNETTLPELLPCPFCGGAAEIDACDRLITVRCRPCGYSRGFRGLLQTTESPVRVSDREYYHPRAKEAAVAVWNSRAQQATADLRAELEQCRADAERLNYLINNECQVWEVNRRFSIRDVTEAHAVTGEFMTARDAIDAARGAK